MWVPISRPDHLPKIPPLSISPLTDRISVHERGLGTNICSMTSYFRKRALLNAMWSEKKGGGWILWRSYRAHHSWKEAFCINPLYSPLGKGNIWMIVSRSSVSVGKEETDSSEFSNKSQFLHSKNFHLNHIINVVSRTHSIRNKMRPILYDGTCLWPQYSGPETWLSWVRV